MTDMLVIFISNYLSNRCSCFFSQHYIADGEILCSTEDSNCVIFQGRLLGSQDTDSVEMLIYLKEWSMTMPTTEVGKVELQIASNSLTYPPTGSSTKCEPVAIIEEEHAGGYSYLKEFVGTTIILALLVLVAVIFAVIAVTLCLKLSAMKKK